MRKFSDGEICKWVLKIGGKDVRIAQGSDSDLDLALFRMLNSGELNGLEKLPDFKNEDTIFYSKTALEEAVKKVEQIQETIKGVQKVKAKVTESEDIYGNTVEETEYYLAIDDSVGVSSVIHHVDMDGEPLVKPMDKEAFKEKRTNDYKTAEKGQFITYGGRDIADLIENTSAEELVNQEMESWEDLTEIGTKIHAVFEAIFKDETPKYEEIFKKKHDTDPDISEEVFNILVNDVKAFKKSIQQKWGENCKFYPELGILSKNLSPEMLMKLQQANKNSINGIIDLLVVDEKGHAHIIDYKVSRKLVGSWDGFDGMDKTWDYDKKQSASYQIELYKQMLKQYGFDTVDTYIVPIKTDLSYKDPNNLFKVTSLNGVRFATNFSVSESLDTPIIANPGSRNNGKHASIISKNFFIPQTFSTPADISAIAKAHDTFFPKHGAISRLQDKKSDIAYYRGNKNYVRELKPGEYKYDEGKRFRVSLPGYHKQADYVSTEKEVTTILTDYIEHRSDMQATRYLSFADAIQNIKDGTADINALLNLGTKGSEKALQSYFARYLRNDWTFIPDVGANSIGIFRFVKNNKCELVCLTDTVLGKNMSDYGQKNSLGFWKGTSILGKTVSDKNVDKRHVLDALSENIEAMKIMSYVSLHPELFERTRIAEIKVINPSIGQMDSKLNSTLIYNFNRLVSENPNCGVSRIKSSLFLDDKVAAVEGAQEWFPDIKINFAKPDNTANFYTEKWFLNRIKEFEREYRANFDKNHYENTEIWNAYQRLKQGLLACRGYENQREQDKSDILGKNAFEINGLLISSPQFSSSSNIRMLSQVIDEYTKEVRKQVYELGFPMAKAFQELYEEKGTGEKVFRNWFVNSNFKDPKNELRLKDPNSSEFNGSPVERKCLDLFLKTLWQLRNPGVSLDNLVIDDHYFEIPLLEAKASRQAKRLGIFSMFKNKYHQYKTLTEGLFMGEEQYDFEKNAESVYNKFDVSDEIRQERLREHGPGMFETDLELVFNEALVAYKRSQVSETYLPLIAAMKTNLEYIDAQGTSKNTKNMKNIKETFDKLVKSKVYNESIIDERIQPLVKFLNVLKAGFTAMTLSLNVRSFLRESLQGIWAGVSRSGVKMYPGIDEKSYIEGLTQVIQDSSKNFSGVSLLNQLNSIYGMANMSINQLAQQRRINWAHINHLGKDTLFLTATAPDFMHRMSLLVAKMKHDGCWEAHSLDENGQLVYDFKKDKRFEHFVKGETSHKDYTKEKSLYLTMIQDFNDAGFRKADGSMLNGEEMDALPQAYTRQEGQSIKNYADLLYGHYDDESRSLLCDTFFGAFFLQYKTYLTAKLEQWTMHEGKYNIAELKQQFDDQGNEMYVRYYYDSENLPHKDILLKNEYEVLSEEEKQTCRLFYDYEGLPMQGMLQESFNFLKNVLTWNTEDLKRMLDDPTSRAMLQLAFHDTFIMGFLGLLVTFIFGSAFDLDNPASKNEVRKALRDMGPIENLTYNVIAGSIDDFQLTNILGSFANRPALLTSAQKMVATSMNVITGKANMVYWATQNFGLIRDFQGAAKHLTDI